MSSCTPKVAPRNLGNLISHQRVAEADEEDIRLACDNKSDNCKVTSAMENKGEKTSTKVAYGNDHLGDRN